MGNREIKSRWVSLCNKETKYEILIKFLNTYIFSLSLLVHEIRLARIKIFVEFKMQLRLLINVVRRNLMSLVHVPPLVFAYMRTQVMEGFLLCDRGHLMFFRLKNETETTAIHFCQNTAFGWWRSKNSTQLNLFPLRLDLSHKSPIHEWLMSCSVVVKFLPPKICSCGTILSGTVYCEQLPVLWMRRHLDNRMNSSPLSWAE